MNSSSEMKVAYESLKKEIYDELRFALQFALSHHFLQSINIKDLPPQFEHIKIQMIEAFWAMIPTRILIIIDPDKQNACSLLRFIQLSFHLKIIDSKKKDELEARLETLKNSSQLNIVKDLRDKVIAHSDKKKPIETKIVTSPILKEVESIFLEAGGNPLDTKELEEKLGDTWSCMFDLMRAGLGRLR